MIDCDVKFDYFGRAGVRKPYEQNKFRRKKIENLKFDDFV